MGMVRINEKKNLNFISSSINFAISLPAMPPCSIPIVIFIPIFNFSQNDISATGFILCSVILYSEGFSDLPFDNSKFIPHFGQRLGFANLTSGCIGQV